MGIAWLRVSKTRRFDGDGQKVSRYCCTISRTKSVFGYVFKEGNSRLPYGTELSSQYQDLEGNWLDSKSYLWQNRPRCLPVGRSH